MIRVAYLLFRPLAVLNSSLKTYHFASQTALDSMLNGPSCCYTHPMVYNSCVFCFRVLKISVLFASLWPSQLKTRIRNRISFEEILTTLISTSQYHSHVAINRVFSSPLCYKEILKSRSKGTDTDPYTLSQCWMIESLVVHHILSCCTSHDPFQLCIIAVCCHAFP